MIVKGNQRGGGQQLATHLMNEFDNEIDLAEVRGTVAQDLHGAFAEFHALASATQCKKYLYSLSINPWDDVNGPLSRDQYVDFIERTEQRLGLEDQPRAIIFHEKFGREHAHVVWSRIYYDEDKDKMLAKQLSYDHQDLRSVAIEFARDHKLTLPERMQKEVPNRFDQKREEVDLADKQKIERAGFGKKKIKAMVTPLWETRDTPQSLVKALESEGLFVARGDKAPYVVVTRYGEVESLAKMIDIKGVNTKEVTDFLGKVYPSDELPGVDRAKAYAAQLIDVRKEEFQKTFRAKADRLQLDLKKAQRARRKRLDERIKAAKMRQRDERNALRDVQTRKTDKGRLGRILTLKKGIGATLLRVTGLHALANFAHTRLMAIKERSNRAQEEALKQRHRFERLDLKRQSTALDKIDHRERLALETRLRMMERGQIIDRSGEDERARDLERELEEERQRQRERDRKGPGSDRSR